MLIGKDIAIVPLGISCQTAYQIERHQEYLEGILRTRLRRRRTPFDWRIVGLDNIASMIERKEFCPSGADELTFWSREPRRSSTAGTTSGANRRAYWQRERCWFWHESVPDFDEFRTKQRHLVQNLMRIEDTRERLFFISNIQANLPMTRKDAQGFEIPIRWDHLCRLKAALERRFGPSSLHVVTRPDLVEGFSNVENARPGESLMLGGKADGAMLHSALPDSVDDPTGWHGDTAVWDRVFQSAIRDRSDHGCVEPPLKSMSETSGVEA